MTEIGDMTGQVTLRDLLTDVSRQNYELISIIVDLTAQVRLLREVSSESPQVQETLVALEQAQRRLQEVIGDR